MNKKIILATVTTVAALATAAGVKADETNPNINKESSEITAKIDSTQNETGTSIQNQGKEQSGNSESTESHRENDNSTGERGSVSTSFEKNGNVIQVNNPNVIVDQSKGTGKYQGFQIEYKDINFPDEMQINQGDKVVLTMPEEVNFQTRFEFDVTNPEQAIVGKATTNPEDRTVTTVFNNYFSEHPLNKQMSLKFDAKWTDKVESGKPVSVNFNGTVVSANIGKEQVIGKNELVAKWGSQDKEDPSVINWTARINYAKRVLNYVTIIDEMSENQKLVDNYFEIKSIESLDPWIDKGSAMDLVKSISKSDHGFTIKMDRLDHMIYINYKTKLVNAVKDSVNPTNKIELKAENDGSTSYSYVQLVGGKGDAVGENKTEPTFEIPKESPKVEIPEFQGGIPGIPEVREKPEYNEPVGTVPNEAPVYEKPEWQGGVVPNEAPVHYMPELIIEIPEEPVKPKEEPKTPQATPKQEPKTPSVSPKIETKKENVEVVNNTEAKSEEAAEVYNAPATLPNTGTETGLALAAIGVMVMSYAVTLKRKESKDME
nr:MAG TPA: putative outer membrane protein [Caudoviricetes sp.]